MGLQRPAAKPPAGAGMDRERRQADVPLVARAVMGDTYINIHITFTMYLYAAGGAAGRHRQLVANQLAAAADEDGWSPFGEIRLELLAGVGESHLTPRLFGGMLRKVAALPAPAG